MEQELEEAYHNVTPALRLIPEIHQTIILLTFSDQAVTSGMKL